MITLFLSLSLTLFFTGLYNCIRLSEKNILSFLVAVEIMLLGIDMLFIVSSLLFNHAEGMVLGVFVLMLAVGESAVGLGLCITSLRLNKHINFYAYSNLKA